MFADFNAWFGPVQLQNLRVGMSKQQAMILAAGALSPLAPAAGLAVMPISPLAGIGLATIGGPAARIAALYTLYKGPFMASAQLSAPVGGLVRFGVGASLGIDAAIAAKYNLATLDAGVEGAVELNLNLVNPGGPPTIQINYENADVDFSKKLELAANLKMELLLNAFMRATLLDKWNWYRTWNLARTPIDQTWPLTPTLRVENKRGGGGAAPSGAGANPMTNSILGSIGETEAELTLGKDDQDPSDADAVDFLRRALGKATASPEEKSPIQGAGGDRTRHFQPVGTREDPILVNWYKPSHWYLDPIQLDIGKGREDFRRNRRVMLPNGEGIGVTHWPRVGEVFLITGTPTPRSGREQAAFRRTLERYGFSWRGWDADHVWDLGLSGFDDYTNLWPLESGVNSRAGNWQLGQSVQYNKPDDPPGTRRTPIAIKGNPDLAGKWFKIRDFKDPP